MSRRKKTERRVQKEKEEKIYREIILIELLAIFDTIGDGMYAQIGDGMYAHSSRRN